MENLDVDDIIAERQKEAVDSVKVVRRPAAPINNGNEENSDGPV